MIEFPTNPTSAEATNTLADKLTDKELDLRMVLALAGERDLNAREQATVEKLKLERGESLFSDMLYALTHKTFPSRQAKTVWAEIGEHRADMLIKLGRDPGMTVATHDYLANKAGLIKNISLIEEGKLASLAEVAIHDGLTGLIDKKTFMRRMQEELDRQHRYGGELTLVMLDIDHFKKLNDTFGHADGDIALVKMADIMRQQARVTDVCGRYGGEEFVILLIGVGKKAGIAFAERLRQVVENRFEPDPYNVTISVGVAASEKAEEKPVADSLIRKADELLYKAKAAGRNRVCY